MALHLLHEARRHEPLPDTVHRQASDVLVSALYQYVRQGGHVFVAFDAALLDPQQGRYAAPQSRLSDMVGSTYALYEQMGDDTTAQGPVYVSRKAEKTLAIQPGRPARAAARVGRGMSDLSGASLHGHDAAWREWRAAMASPRMHHAWILAGLKGVGKGLFARAAAAELVAEAGIPQPPADRHPDILIPEHPPENKEEAKKREDGGAYKRKRAIPIDEIRMVQQRLVTRPTLGSRRVVIIDPADDLEKNASNALLKSLEEPPAGTYFLLVTHKPGRLLPTIRSRCRLLTFDPLSEADVGEAGKLALERMEKGLHLGKIVIDHGGAR